MTSFLLIKTERGLSKANLLEACSPGGVVPSFLGETILFWLKKEKDLQIVFGNTQKNYQADKNSKSLAGQN